MPPFMNQVFDRVFTAPPMPPQAFPPGLLGKTPGAKEAMEQAWRTMFFATLTQGMILGALAMIAVIVAVLLRSNLKAAIQEAINHAVK